RLQPGMLDLPAALHLLDQQRRVGEDRKPVDPVGAGKPQSLDEGLYSATLLVAQPMPFASSSTTAPSGPTSTTPIPAGPGFPLAAPSVRSCHSPLDPPGFGTLNEGCSDHDQDALALVTADEAP